jgi:hypothetical protein
MERSRGGAIAPHDVSRCADQAIQLEGLGASPSADELDGGVRAASRVEGAHQAYADGVPRESARDGGAKEALEQLVQVAIESGIMVRPPECICEKRRREAGLAVAGTA